MPIWDISARDRSAWSQIAVTIGSNIYGGRANAIVAAPINGALGAFLSFKGICSAREPREAITFELRILALSVVLGLVHIVLASHAMSLQRGYRWTASSRERLCPV
jgi:hypothetical protein